MKKAYATARTRVWNKRDRWHNRLRRRDRRGRSRRIQRRNHGAGGRLDAGPPRVDAGSSRDAAIPPAADGSVGRNAGSLTCNLSGAATAATPTIYVIGDSTASLYASDLYPRMGWGQPLQDYYAPACATIQDAALSGRSSKSFFDEGAWTPVPIGRLAKTVPTAP